MTIKFTRKGNHEIWDFDWMLIATYDFLDTTCRYIAGSGGHYIVKGLKNMIFTARKMPNNHAS